MLMPPNGPAPTSRWTPATDCSEAERDTGAEVISAAVGVRDIRFLPPISRGVNKKIGFQ